MEELEIHLTHLTQPSYDASASFAITYSPLPCQGDVRAQANPDIAGMSAGGEENEVNALDGV